MPFLRDRLASLATDLFIFVADALALVGLRLPQRPHLGSELPHELLVDPLDRDVRLIRAGDAEFGGNGHLQFVGEANAELERVLLDRREVSDTDDLEFLLETLGDTLHHVCGQGPGEPVNRSGQPTVAVAGDGEHVRG